MATQTYSIGYLEIPGVEALVRARVYVPKSGKRSDIQKHCQNPENELTVLSSANDVRVAYALRDAKNDRYSALANQQPLVKAGKVPVNVMRLLLRKFYGDVWGKYKILPDEVADSNPKARKFELPEGKKIAVYRGWRIGDDGDIDVSGVNPIFLGDPSSGLGISQEWMSLVGMPDKVIFSNLKQINGVNVIRWDYEPTSRSIFEISYGYRAELKKSGALVASTVPMDGIVAGFDYGAFRENLLRSVPKSKRESFELFESPEDIAEDELEEQWNDLTDDLFGDIDLDIF